jgi:hypothetical protein
MDTDDLQRTEFLAMAEAISVEVGCAVFYMENIAFGFTFSGSFDELIEKQQSIQRIVGLYGYWHRN